MGIIKLQGHEKFALRDGWLSKGFEQLDCENYSNVFTSASAPDVFGIGTNMVKSLRYWLRAFSLTEESRNGVKLSRCGQLIKENDPYLEDSFTLFILHSNIVKNINIATSWHFFFNYFDLPEFDKEMVFNVLLNELNKYNDTPSKEISQKSLRSDIDIILGMYSKGKEISDPEDKNTSPFSGLGLIKQAADRKYILTTPDNRLINETLLLYELAERLSDTDSLSIDSLTSGRNSLKTIYHLGSITINEYLDILDSRGYIRVDRTAGLDMVYKKADFTAESVLFDYYNNTK